MSWAKSLEGSAYFIAVLALALAAAARVMRARYRHLSGVQRVLAFCVFATAALIYAYVIPAAMGILGRTTALIAALVIFALACLLPRREVSERRRVDPPPASSFLSLAISVVAVAAAVVYEFARARTYLHAPPTFIDTTAFHLPGVVTWIQTGSLWRVDQFVPGFATAQYPNNGDFLILGAVLPWHDLALAGAITYPFYLLTGVATYALAVEAGASRAAAATFAAVVVTLPDISAFSFRGMPDHVTLSMFAIGLLFLLRYSRSRAGPDLVLAGLALGLSFGTKWYGLTSIVVVLAVWFASSLLARRAIREVIREAAIVIGMIAAGGGIWLVRNLVESGNPIYPKAVSLLGVSLFQGSNNDVVDKYGYSITNYLGQPHILRHYIYPAFRLAFGVTGLVILAALLIVAARLAKAVWHRYRRDTTRFSVSGGALLLMVLGMLLVYIVTPGTAYGVHNQPLDAYPPLRWLMPAAIVAVVLAAVAARELGRAGLLLELAGLAALLNSIRTGEHVSGSTFLTTAVVLGALYAGVALARARLRWRWRYGVRPAMLGGCAIAVAVSLALLIRAQQQRFDRNAYASFDPVFAYIDAHASSSYRVGITGIFDTRTFAPTLPAAGPHLENHVSYVGDWNRHSLAVPASFGSFQREVRRGGYNLLIVGLVDPHHTDQWARTLGYRLLVSSHELALYGAPS